MFEEIKLPTVISIIAFCVMPAPLFAEQEATDKEPSPLEANIYGNFTLVSDYLFRGETLSDGKPALQGGIDYINDNGFFLGTWASSGDKQKPLEIDIYSGFENSITDNSAFLVELRGYIYPHVDNDDTIEATIAALIYDARLQYYYDFQLEQHYLEAAYQHPFSKAVNSEFRVGMLSKDNVAANTNNNIWDVEFTVDYGVTTSTRLYGELAYHEKEKSNVAIGLTTLFSL